MTSAASQPNRGHRALRLAALLSAFVLYKVLDREVTVAFQREVVRFADREVMAEGRRMRNEYLAIVRTVLSDGIDAGEFRDCDVNVQSLLIFGSAQWAWTWFEPDGPVTAEQVGAQLVDLVLGGLLFRHIRVEARSNPAGRAARTVRACLAEVAAKQSLPEAS